MPHTLIEQNTAKENQKFYSEFNKKPDGVCELYISEMFGDTLQGEGVNTGIPATFIRLQGCTLKCSWCDTLNVWPNGDGYNAEEIFWLMEKHGLIQKLDWGQHLIFTGGSPLKQQDQIVTFLKLFQQRYGFKPYVEVENEAVLSPMPELVELVDCWNNSPKLENSDMKLRVRYKEDILRETAALENSWFKFVVRNEQDWKEIKELYLDKGIVKSGQVILMPEGQTQEELQKSREYVAELCCTHNIRYSDRLHIVIWDKKTGV